VAEVTPGERHMSPNGSEEVKGAYRCGGCRGSANGAASGPCMLRKEEEQFIYSEGHALIANGDVERRSGQVRRHPSERH